MEKLVFRTVAPQLKELRFTRGERLSFAYRGETACRPREINEIRAQMMEQSGDSLVISHPAALPEEVQGIFRAAEERARKDFALPANLFHDDLNKYLSGVGFASRIYRMDGSSKMNPQMAATLRCPRPDGEFRKFFGEACDPLAGYSAIIAIQDDGVPLGLLSCSFNLALQLAGSKLRRLAVTTGLDPRQLTAAGTVFYDNAYAYTFGYYLSQLLLESPSLFRTCPEGEPFTLLNFLPLAQREAQIAYAAMGPEERRNFAVAGDGLKEMGRPLMVDLSIPGLLAFSAQERPRG